MPKPTTLKEAMAEVDQERISACKALLSTICGPKVIVTLRKAEPNPQPPGGTIAACQECHAACWITPMGRTALELPGARALCIECAVKECVEAERQGKGTTAL
jgi:hypothetical protein